MGSRWSILILVVVAIGVLTLAPSPNPQPTGAPQCVFCGQRALADAVSNVILYLPFGVALSLLGVRARHALLLGFALSTCIEATQVILPGRDASLGDVITNALGTLLGVLITASAATWLNPPRRMANTLCLGTAVVTVATFALSGILLTPSLPETVYYGQWTPNLRHLEWYRGHIRTVTVDGVEVGSGRVPNSGLLRASLLAGAAVEVHAVAGPQVRRLASLFSVYDEGQREIFLIGPDRDEFVLRYRTRAAELRLDEPDLRVKPQADLRPGDSLLVRTWAARTGRCLQVATTSECGLGFSVGLGWSLLFYPESFPRWLKQLLNFCWIAGFFGVVAFWTRQAAVPGLALGSMLTTMAVTPLLTELVSTPPVEWAAAAAGLVAGRGLLAVTRRFGSGI